MDAKKPDAGDSKGNLMVIKICFGPLLWTVMLLSYKIDFNVKVEVDLI